MPLVLFLCACGANKTETDEAETVETIAGRVMPEDVISAAMMNGELQFPTESDFSLQRLADSGLKLSYGTSSIYTKSDMDAAVSVILEEFKSWEEMGCEMHSISYVSDACNSEKNITWMNELSKDGTVYTQCIAFVSDYHSPKTDAGAWNEDFEYEDWQWWLARTDGGPWVLLTWGY